MTSKETLSVIKQLLGLSKSTFGMVGKSVDGTELSYEKMELGMPIYVITEEGQIPAPEGEYELEDGMVIGVREGAMAKLDMTKKKMEEEVKVEETEKVEEKMVQAELVDGTLVEVEGEEITIGAKLMVRTEDGLVVAPDGSHETKDGKIITVVDGVITDVQTTTPEVAEEGLTEEASVTELASVLKSVVEKMTSEMEVLKKKNAELENKFSKFSAQPAGSKVIDRKGYVEHLMTARVDKLEALKSLKSKK